jgi:hypothetical protein
MEHHFFSYKETYRVTGGTAYKNGSTKGDLNIWTGQWLITIWSLETRKDELTDRGTAFDGRMGAFHVGGIDKAEVGIHGGAD